MTRMSVRSSGRSRSGVALVGCLVIGALAAAPALAQSGQKKQAASGKKLEEFKQTCMGINQQIDATVASLNKVVEQAASDPRTPYKQFLKDVDTMQDLAKKGRSSLEDMQKAGQTYFENWQKELGKVTNPDIKARAEERKMQLQTYSENVKTSLAAGKEDWTKFLANLKDINTVLSNDLTPAGINSVKDIITQLNTEGEAAKSKLNDVLTAVDSYKNELSPTPQAAPSGGSE